MKFLNGSIKIKNIILLISFIFINISFSNSQEISEIMYDPSGSDTGQEWIEIYNNSSNSINLINYKLFEANINHGITTVSTYVNPNGNSLEIGEYAVIVDDPVKFLNSHPGFTGKLFNSSFSLSNTGELLEFRGAGAPTLSSITYIPQPNANGTGGTLNYINNSWQVYSETPGASSTLITVANTGSTSGSGSNSTTNGTTTNSTSTSTGSSSSMGSYASYISSGSNRFTLGDLKMLVPREINTVVGAETEFFVKNIDNKNGLVNAQTYWSFGDGSEGIGTSTKHRYQNVGVYNAFIESEVSNSYGVDRIVVKVENPNIEISDVQDSYVELYNKSDIELNIGRFIIASDQGFYQLSRMFIINPESKVKVDGRVLGFSKLTNVKLLSAYNTFVTKYENKNLQNTFGQVFLSDVNSTSTLTTLQNLSSTTQIKNKVIYKNKVRVVSNGLAPKKNPKLIIMGTSTKSELKVDNKVIEVSLDKESGSFIKKWLYWIYE